VRGGSGGTGTSLERAGRVSHLVERKKWGFYWWGGSVGDDRVLIPLGG